MHGPSSKTSSRSDSPSQKKENSAVTQMSPDNMVDANDLDHLILEEDKVPSDEEVFAPDPDTEPYLTEEVLSEEEAADVYVSTVFTRLKPSSTS